MSEGREQSAEQLRLMWRITGMAFMFSAEVAAGALIGMLIDHWRGANDQRWLYIGGIVGVVIGMTGFIRAAFKLNKHNTGTRRP